ncbi:hypothetical protein C6N75_26935 [Streptomyces solincola]|uniref:Uncharacterized protein n=1 Tax=Streptomyces solincola TaxID=2100817 RepID=A0A2S9PP66_9ACTN|nr:hypothetical protein C6N75_26935 [Streptomyces solincola]
MLRAQAGIGNPTRYSLCGTKAMRKVFTSPKLRHLPTSPPALLLSNLSPGGRVRLRSCCGPGGEATRITVRSRGRDDVCAGGCCAMCPAYRTHKPFSRRGNRKR